MKRNLILGSMGAALGLHFCCHKNSHEAGVFFGEENFKDFTEGYSRSLNEAEAILKEHCQKTGENWSYIPYKVVFATEGGYLFFDGEFKINIQAAGYFVDQDGEVSWRDLRWSISVDEYLSKIEVDRNGTKSSR